MKKIILSLVLLLWALPAEAQSLQRAIEHHGCGLKYVHKSIKISTRTILELGMLGNEMPVTLTVNELPTGCYEIVGAYLWWTESYNDINPQFPQAYIYNPFGDLYSYTPVLTGQSVDKCWREEGTRGFRADITSCIQGNGEYIVRVTTSDSETDGLTMIIFYRDYSEPWEGHVLINDGLFTINNTNRLAFYDTLQGINTCGSPALAQTFMIVSDIQPMVAALYFTVNGYRYRPPRDFWNSEIRSTTLDTNQTESVFGIDSEGDCYSWQMMGVYYRTTSCNYCREIQPVIALSDADTVCEGSTVKLWALGVDSCRWVSEPPGDYPDSSIIYVNPKISTKFTVVSKSPEECFLSYDSVIVHVNQKPDILLSDEIKMCLGEEILIVSHTDKSGARPFTYKWWPTEGIKDSTSPQTLASPDHDTKYYLTVTDAKGCSSTDSVMVRVSPRLIVDAGPDRSTDYMQPVLIGGNPPSGGTPPYQYHWTPSVYLTTNGLPQVEVRVPWTVIFIVKVTDAVGCVSYDSVKVIVTPGAKPKVNAGPDLVVCPGDTFWIGDSAKGGVPPYTYSWSPRQFVKSPNSPITQAAVDNTTEFILRVTDSESGIGFDTVLVTVIPKPFLRLPSNKQINICAGDSVTIDLSPAEPGTSYRWSTGDTTIKIKVGSPGTYYIQAKNNAGCKNFDSVSVTIRENLDIEIIPMGPVDLCDGDSVVLRAEPYNVENTYIWSTGSFAKEITVKKGGIYHISVQSPGGCKGYDSITINVQSSIVPVITTADGNNELCKGGNKTLTAMPVGTGYKYEWSTGDTSNPIIVDKPGIYSVQVSLNEKCKGFDDIEIFELPPPQINIIGDNVICIGDTIILSADREFESYKWSNGETGRVIKITVGGIYSLTAIDSNGCIASAEKSVNESEINLSITDHIDFGELCYGSSTSSSFIIDNKGYETIHISVLKTNSDDAEYIFNYTPAIEPGTEQYISVNIEPRQIKYYNDTILVLIDEPCRHLYKVPVTGIVKSRIISSLPDIIANIGDNITIPLTHVPDCGLSLPSDITYTAILKFKATALLPEVMQEAGVIDNGIMHDYRVFSIAGTGMQIKSIRAKVMIGEQDVSPLIIETVTRNNSLVDTILQNGSLTVEGICQRSISRIKLLNAFTITVSPNPVFDEALITMYGNMDHLVRLSVYTINGMLKDEKEFFKTKGVQKFNLDLKEYSSGIYNIVLRTPDEIISYPVIVVK